MFVLCHNQSIQFGATKLVIIGVADTKERLEAEQDALCESTKRHLSKMREYEASRNYYLQTVRRCVRGFLEGNRNALIEQKKNGTMNWHDESNVPYPYALKRRLEDELIQQIVDNYWHYFLPDEERWNQFININALRANETVLKLPPYPKEPVLGVVYAKEHFFIQEAPLFT